MKNRDGKVERKKQTYELSTNFIEILVLIKMVGI